MDSLMNRNSKEHLNLFEIEIFSVYQYKSFIVNFDHSNVS